MPRGVHAALLLLLLASAMVGCLGGSEDLGPAATEPGETDARTELAIPEQLPGLSGERVVEDLEAFTDTAPLRSSPSPMLADAVNWLDATLEETGLDITHHVAEVESTQCPDREQVTNIIATHPGTTTPDELLVVAAHYDGANTGVGHAYDPGSATMALIELARAAAAIDFHHTIIFALWDGHECGLLGSEAWLDDIQAAGEKHVVADMTLDMVGLNWPLEGQHINSLKGWIGNDEGDTLREELEHVAFTKLDYPEGPITFKGHCDGCNSHAAFDEAGIPHVFFSTFPFQNLPEGLTSHYPFFHNVDTVEQLKFWAGGQEELEDGFETVLELSLHGLVHMDRALASDA